MNIPPDSAKQSGRRNDVRRGVMHGTGHDQAFGGWQRDRSPGDGSRVPGERGRRAEADLASSQARDPLLPGTRPGLIPGWRLIGIQSWKFDFAGCIVGSWKMKAR